MLCQFPQPGKQGLSLPTPHEILHYHERGCSVTRGCFGTATATFLKYLLLWKARLRFVEGQEQSKGEYSKSARKWNLVASCCLLSHISPCHNSTSQGWAVILLGLPRDLCWARSSIKGPGDRLQTISSPAPSSGTPSLMFPTMSSPKFTLTQSRRFHTNT